jgi:hypothetical protein
MKVLTNFVSGVADDNGAARSDTRVTQQLFVPVVGPHFNS